jgi:hypothetical protein
MPDLGSNEELKQKETNTKAQASLLRAEVDLLKAQQELTAATKPPDPTVAANSAETARLEALKGLLEARKALSDVKKGADLAAAQAAIGTVAGSAIEGSVTVKNDAGKGEATLLASRAIVRAAANIVEVLTAKLAKKRIVLLPGTEAPQFANYRQFLLQQALLLHAFQRAQQEADRLEQQGKLAEAPAPSGAAEALHMLTTAGVVVDAVAKLGSYFLSNYEIGGIAITPDTDQLVSAVADSLLRAGTNAVVILPARRIPQTTDFGEMIQQLADQTIAADSRAFDLGDAARRATELSESGADTAKRLQLQQAAKLFDQAAALLRNAIGKTDEFIAALGAADAKGVALMTKIAQEKSVCDELANPDARGLLLDVRAAVGGYYTRKNLWTFLGRMPFFAMGGTVVTYTLINKNGEIEASGLVPIHSGYSRVDQLK